MLDILLWIAAVVAVVALAVIAYASRKPDTFAVSRSADIAAPPEKLFAILTDFRRWPEWSPWQHLDPGMQQTLSGSPSGVGAVSEWSGNGKVGAGRTEITDVAAPTRIGMRLDMLRPMKASNRVDYTLEPNGHGTRVTWAMSGRQPLPAKIFASFVDCDNMVGRDFERGLANLKALAER